MQGAVMGMGLALAFAGFGCATQDLSPPPTAAQVTAAEAAVRVAREAGPAEGSAGQHLRMAEKQLSESKERARNGNNRAAGLLLARAEADAELSQVLRRREKAIADAEVIEGHLTETKAAATTPVPGPTSTTAPGTSPAVESPPTFGATGSSAAPSATTPSGSATTPAPSTSKPTQPASPEWGRTPTSPLAPNPTTPTPSAP
ncbi:MAG TPA: hypothetical protein VGF45_08960 [Polyangia bacterium]